MELPGYFSLFALVIITSMYYECEVLADEDLFYRVDGTEELTPIFEEDAPHYYCTQPPIPNNGQMACGKLKSDPRRYVCIGRCDTGYEFPNREIEGKIICSLITGNWSPRIEFPDCEKESICQRPLKPLNARMWCASVITHPTRYGCTAECEEGYRFPGINKTRRFSVCDSRTDEWIPESEFPDCEAKPPEGCDPPCQNGGTCDKANKCICTPHFEGDRCAKEKSYPGCVDGWTDYLNTDNPVFSDIGDDERLDRIREIRPFCNGGVIKDIECKAIVNGKLVDYREVGILGLQCSTDTGFICDKNVRQKDCEDFAVRFLCECDVCKAPPEPRNAEMWCTRYISVPYRYACLAECKEGYNFPSGERKSRHTCDTRTKLWTPEYEFPDCTAKCDPPCQNGGTCEEGNVCICTDNFQGERCENEKFPEDCVNGWTQYFNTDNPMFSDIGDDESLDRIREIESFCTGGVIKGIECKAIFRGKLVDYREVGTVGLECSMDTGFTCDKKVRGECEDFTVSFLCECGVNKTEEPPSVQPQMCPEVPPHILHQCPASCPVGFACFRNACVPKESCPCFQNSTSFLPTKSIWISENCEKCECKIGGNTRCESLECPGCLPGDIEVMDSACHCKCVNCPETAVFCPEKGECLEKELLCKGSVQCPGIQTTCATAPPLPELPPEKIPENCSIDQQSDTDTCEISGNMFLTFDGLSYQYDTCSHVLMKEQIFESFSVTVHKMCISKNPVKCYRHLIINVDELFINFGPGVSNVIVQSTHVPLRSLWLVPKKFPQIELKEIGNALVFRSLKYDFEVTWDKMDNSKIKVSKCLIDRIVGLCGLYNRKSEDDMKMSNGTLAKSDKVFGDNWALRSLNTCSQPNYTTEISSTADVSCAKLREEPFKSCYETADLNRKVQACVSFMRECLQKSVKAGTRSLDESEKCKCLAFETFAEDCEIFKKRSGEWRILHGCVPSCSHGMEWNDCGPGCQLTCDNYHQRFEICTSTCVPGCYCPLGLIRHQNQCVKPQMCQDCICRGHGGPNYITFDGRYYAFRGTCTYILAQHLKSDDKSMNFRVQGTNIQCFGEPNKPCIQTLKILWNGHIIQKRKFQPVYVGQKPITPDESPYDKGGIRITYVPNKNTLIHIKNINLVLRYFDQMDGFTIEIPSFYYYNKTEGLCGVCNFNESDDFHHRGGYVTNNTEDFVYSWLIGNKRQNCELEPEAVVEPLPAICNFTASPCEALLDPSLFLKICQNDARYSRWPEISMCKSKFQYAQQCCERGVPLDEWLKLSGCIGSCPPGMMYKCTSPCPKTCENYKTYREDDCFVTPQYGCVCPEGEVLELGKCVKTSACEVCDKMGHGMGEVWQADPCKTCECLPDLTTKCTVHQCPEAPVCGEQETLLKAEARNDTCCASYKCVFKSEVRNCKEPKLKACPVGTALVMKQSGDLCPIYQCECFPQLCPPSVTPELDDGETFRFLIRDCCPEVQIACNPNSCAPSLNCSDGFRLSTQKGRCCVKRNCVPEENVCVYQHRYEVINGIQVKLPLGRFYDKEYQPGSVWHDGLCRECTCEDIKGRLMSQCKLEVCLSREDFPDSEKYVMAEVRVPGLCCPKYVRKLCVDQGVNYKIGDEWSSPMDNFCRKISRCMVGSTGEALFNETVKCEPPCDG